MGLIYLFLAVFTGQNAVIGIPLATAGSATAEAVLLAVILYFRLRKNIKAESP